MKAATCPTSESTRGIRRNGSARFRAFLAPSALESHERLGLRQSSAVFEAGQTNGLFRRACRNFGTRTPCAALQAAIAAPTREEIVDSVKICRLNPTPLRNPANLALVPRLLPGNAEVLEAPASSSPAAQPEYSAIVPLTRLGWVNGTSPAGGWSLRAKCVPRLEPGNEGKKRIQ